MNNNNWAKQEKIFHRALELAGEERNSFLLKTCSDDDIQLREIQSLIQAFENSENFLDEPIFNAGLGLLHKQNGNNPANSNIGIYQVREKIGEGGMGEVYDAFDTKLNRRVALKFLSESFDDDNFAKRQLVREAQAVALLDHPNICAVYDFQETEKHHFIVMQYIEGLTLAELIKKSPVNREQVLSITRQIISAVAFAHSNGIIHRDLKPANIMIKNDGQIKVLDFGLAKSIGQISNLEAGKENTSLVSQNGLIIGTVSYMSPEQLRGEKLDYQSDIFTIGIILYELVSGKNPFTRKSQAETIASILNENPVPLKDLKINTPIDLSAIVQKCLEKDKAKRFQSAAEILVELDNAKLNKTTGLVFNLKSASISLLLTVLLILLSVFAVKFIYPEDKQKRSFAVLPIANKSEQAEYQYLADGFTRDLIENLSGLSVLDVKSESYISRFKDQSINPQTAGQELNVEAVLDGALIKRGNSVFLDLKIIKTSDGSVLDAAEFLIKESDLIALQEKISSRIISKMDTELTEKDKARLNKNNPRNPEALRLYFQGRYYWSRREGKDLENALFYFKEATDLEPSYAKAWAGLADSYAFYSVPGESGTISTEEAVMRAKAAAKNALQIDNTLSEPHSALGTIKLRFEWDWVGAEKHFRDAINLDPEFAPARYGLSNVLLITGRFYEALAEAQKMKEFDPFSVSSDINIGKIYYYKRDYEKTTQIYSELLNKDPGNLRILYLLGFQYLKTGKLKEAIKIFEKIYDSNPLFASAGLGYAYGKTGQKDKARKILEGLEQLSRENYISSQEKAIIYLGLGDTDKVFEHLKAACDERFPAFPHLVSDPLLDEIRPDPRFSGIKQCASLI